ncbi:MAG: hypothetical protein ACK53A_04645 [Gemmatimonadota bacterium]|jgi:hypothetical protein|nr:hypothetical protein [Gemmatimonadota bacterium]
MPPLTPPREPGAVATARHPGRLRAVLQTTALVSAAGAVAGAIAAPVVLTVATLARLVVSGGGVPDTWTAVVNAFRGAGALGTLAAVYGAVLGPLLGWTLLRRVPIGRAAVTCAVGAAVFLVLGLVLLPLAFDGLLALAYPVVGGLVTALALRWRQRDRASAGADAGT